MEAGIVGGLAWEGLAVKVDFEELKNSNELKAVVASAGGDDGESSGEPSSSTYSASPPSINLWNSSSVNGSPPSGGQYETPMTTVRTRSSDMDLTVEGGSD